MSVPDAEVLGQTGSVMQPNANLTFNTSGAFTGTGSITKTVQMGLEHATLGVGVPPTLVGQDDTGMLEFTVDNDYIYFNIEIPEDYAGSGGLDFRVVWTNDGGVDDNTKAVKVELSYQTTAFGDAISGHHGNSPKSYEDTYDSAAGHIMHRTNAMNIAHADISGKNYVHMVVMFVTPGGAALTSEPRMIGMSMSYTARQVILA